MLNLFGKRSEMFSQIDKNPNCEQVIIRTKPSKSIFFHILQKTKVKEIYMTAGILRTVSVKLRNALNDAGVKTHLIDKKAGRPQKYEKEKMIEAVKRFQQGESATKISKIIGVPAVCIYAWGKKFDRGFAKIIDST
jgi:hypothetical protein